MKRFLLSIAIILLSLCLPVTFVYAQTEYPTPMPGEETEPIPQVHVVQSGENLTYIAQIYDVSVEDLQRVNNLADDAILFVGQKLFIPGGEGDEIATVYEVQVADTLKSIASSFNTTKSSIVKTNNLLNPYYDLFAGQTLSVTSRTGSPLPQIATGIPYLVSPGESLSMIAIKYNLSPLSLAAVNELPYPTYLFPGQRLRIPSEDTPFRDLSGEWTDVRIRPWPILQGSTVSIYVENLLEGQPLGNFAGQQLRFVPQDNGYIALVGLDAFTEQGIVTMKLWGSGNQPWQPFTQHLQVKSGDYGLQNITIPQDLDYLLAPEIRQNEDAFLKTIYTRFSETQFWDGLFQLPVTNTIVTAGYGDARSYNGGPIEIFHTGIDFSGTIGTPILAPANGIVVFSEELELRGLTVIIDHGLGVMSAYFHLSESFVNVGDMVTTGQTIAAGGSTGLSSGPHLHWDLRIMDVPVNGQQWTQVSFP